MFGRKKRAPDTKGKGAAAAKQMGLFLELSPEEMMMGTDTDLGDADLEAEFAALVGKKAAGPGRAGQKAKTALPMEDIEKMAEECMRDITDTDEDDLENDEDLLAELQEVVGEEEGDDAGTGPPSPAETPRPEPEASVPSTPGSVQHTLEERVAMYKAAIVVANETGESSKVRRYERGLKTLEEMLTSVKKGKKVDEADFPPPVSCAPQRPLAAVVTDSTPTPPEPEGSPDIIVETTPVSSESGPHSEEELSSTVTVATLSSQPSPEGRERTGESHTGDVAKATVLGRQREYKMAALRSKQQGDLEQARLYLKTSKELEAVVAVLDGGRSFDLSALPPPPPDGTATPMERAAPTCTGATAPPAQASAASAPPAQAPPPLAPPLDVLEALEQRKARYEEACAQAKAGGDERKARMHDRIVKQYQSAIRAHKAGRPVNLQELPVPPGCPPIPGQEGVGVEQGFAAVLEAANKLAADEQTEEGHEEESPPAPEKTTRPMLAVPPTIQSTPSTPPEKTAQKQGVSATAAEQLDFLEGRRKQYMKAALQAKQREDMDQARSYLRTAKTFEPQIEAARSGKAVDMSKVSSPPGDEDGDFILVHHSDVQLSEKAEEIYAQLEKILKEQQEKCLTYSKQFTHMGNIKETTKFEKMAESFKKSLEILKLSQARGLEPPKHHFEDRTYQTVRIFPELSSTDMVVVIEKGINLPAPQGIASNDLDAYVKFDFPYPSTEQPQRHRTAVVKNTNCPEFRKSFTLSINRSHRGFRRVIQAKGLKLEVLHKGGFLRSDKPVGTALLKLEKLETQSEVREIVEVIDGRKPTGGRLEVRVRLREPLSGQDLQTTTERWLVLQPTQDLL